MGNFLWYKTKTREKLLDSLDSIPEIGRKSKSEILEMALSEFILKHQKSNNPQTMIDLFENEQVLAIPNIYQIEEHPEEWDLFYKLITSKEEYERLDNCLMTIISKHNRKLHEL